MLWDQVEEEWPTCIYEYNFCLKIISTNQIRSSHIKSIIFTKKFNISFTLKLSGFCHFGLVSFMGFVTEPWHSRHVLFLCECAASSALSSAWLVSCCSVVFEFMSGFGHSRSMFCLVVWACGLKFARPLARPLALLSTCVLCCGTQFVFLSAECIHVVLCCVARSLYIHWLRAFMLSCLVWTRGLWVFSLAACSCPVLHMAGD